RRDHLNLKSFLFKETLVYGESGRYTCQRRCGGYDHMGRLICICGVFCRFCSTSRKRKSDNQNSRKSSSKSHESLLWVGLNWASISSTGNKRLCFSKG